MLRKGAAERRREGDPAAADVDTSCEVIVLLALDAGLGDLRENEVRRAHRERSRNSRGRTLLVARGQWSPGLSRPVFLG